MRDPGLDKGRPQAPHLQIYRWTITMAMSIAHRITGVALYVGTFFLTLWLMVLAYDPEDFANLQNFYMSFLGKIGLFLYSFALMHHLFGGIRHLIWETNLNYLEKRKAIRLAWATLFCSLTATLILWLVAFYY